MPKTASSNSAFLTIPFSRMDEAMIHTATVRHHSNVHIEVRATGKLDEARMRKALLKAMGDHPLSRARQVAHKGSDRSFQWEITPKASSDPFLVVEGGSDASVAGVRAQLLNMQPPLHDSPPFLAWLLRRAGGDSVIFNFNHCAGDGIGVLHFLRTVIDYYAGNKLESPSVDPIEIRTAPGISSAQVKQRKQQQENMMEILRRNLNRASHLAPDGQRDQSGYGCHQLIIKTREVKQLKPRRHVKATVNDLLLAAMHKSVELWNENHDTETGLVRVQTPVNLRPPGWQYEVLGNYVGSIPTISHPEERESANDLMSALSRQTQSAKDNGIGAVMYEALQFQSRIPIFAKELLMPGLIDASNSVSAFVSNLGNFSGNLSFGPGDEASELWFSPPALMSAGLGLGAIGYNGSLFLAFRYARDHFDAAATRRFCELYRQTLHWLS